MPLPSETISAAFLDACRLELRALKPGNIGAHGEARGMTVADFEMSAEAAAPIIGARDLGVGARILGAIEATRGVVGHNTNLGIILLAAPLAQAAMSGGDGSLRDRLVRVLANLAIEDARHAYAAIRLAEPGGLDTVPVQDVREEPSVTLLEAMHMADKRDRVAMQYANGFTDVFDMGLPLLGNALKRMPTPEWAATALYMTFLSAFPDGLIARKFGSEAAEEVRQRAIPIESQFAQSDTPEELRTELLAFDIWLKKHALNPGATADLVVATLFANALNTSELSMDER